MLHHGACQAAHDDDDDDDDDDEAHSYCNRNTSKRDNIQTLIHDIYEKLSCCWDGRAKPVSLVGYFTSY